MNLSHMLHANRPEMVLLAPALPDQGEAFARLTIAPSVHGLLLNEVQKLRGRIYLEDGAIRADQLLADGRHEQSVDYKSWHLLIVNFTGSVLACARYMVHSDTASYEDLGARRSALACSEYGPLLKDALESKLRESRRRNIQFVEVGGWALAPEIRCSPASINMALMTFVLAECLGGCIGITTATVRHGSASILQRIGGRQLQASGGIELPMYYDAQYGCEMDILHFDSSQPNPKYRSKVDALSRQIHSVPVICATPNYSYSNQMEYRTPYSPATRVRPEAAA